MAVRVAIAVPGNWDGRGVVVAIVDARWGYDRRTVELEWACVGWWSGIHLWAVGDLVLWLRGHGSVWAGG